MINAIQIALSGLLASSKQTEAVASNVANLQTSGSLENPLNKPYSAITTKQTSLTDNSGNGLGVQSDFVPKHPPFVPVFDPDSPFADENGIIGAPNVNLAEEAVNLKLAEIAFKANVHIIDSVSEMYEEFSRIFDKKV